MGKPESIYISCDAPILWSTYFQDTATPQMEALVELHDNIMFYLVIILFGVAWVLFSIIRNCVKNRISNKYLNHGTLIELIWTITPALILILIAFPSFKLLFLMDEVTDPSITLSLEGHQWYWSYEYPDFLSDDDEELEFHSGTKYESSSSSSGNSSQGDSYPEPVSGQGSVAHGGSSSQGSDDDEDDSSANQSSDEGRADAGPVAECEHGQWIRYPIYSENEICAGAGDRYHNGIPLEHFAYNLNDEEPLICNHCLGVFCADCTDNISGNEVSGNYRYVDPDNCAQFSTGSYARDSSQADNNAGINDNQTQSSSDDSEQ